MDSSTIAGAIMAPLPRFDNTLGVLLLGGLLAMALWGVTCVQTYSYYMDTPRDHKLLKLLVALLWLLDTFDSALNAHILYYYMVSNYLDPLALFKPVWSVIIHVAVTAASNFLIRAMFLTRVYRLSNRNMYLTAGISVISVADLVISTTIAIKAFGINSFIELNNLSALMYSTFGVGTGSDLCLAVTLSYLLFKSRTGFKRTDGLIRMLMMYTVNTGTIVAIDAALGVITYAAMPNNFIFLGFYLLLSKLYVNAYLATLNARKYLQRDNIEMMSFKLSNMTTSTSAKVPDTKVSISDKMVAQSGTCITMRTGIAVSTVVEMGHDDQRLWQEKEHSV